MCRTGDTATRHACTEHAKFTTIEISQRTEKEREKGTE